MESEREVRIPAGDGTVVVPLARAWEELTPAAPVVFVARERSEDRFRSNVTVTVGPAAPQQDAEAGGRALAGRLRGGTLVDARSAGGAGSVVVVVHDVGGADAVLVQRQLATVDREVAVSYTVGVEAYPELRTLLERWVGQVRVERSR